MSTREPYSLEAEQGVLGAMLLKPELIDVLSADLQASDFFFSYNRDVFKAILALKAKGAGVDFLTVSERIGVMDNGDSALAYVAELHRNTPSAANANTYATIVLERSIDRALIAAAETVHELATSDASAEDKIAMAHAEILGISSESAAPETITAGDAMRQHVEELERREELGGKMDGLATGIKVLDDKLLGLKPEQFIVIAGRPKMGKTTLVMNIADHVAVTQRKQVLVFSLEMSHRQLMDKALASLGGIPLDNLKNGSVFNTHTKELTDAASALANSGLTLYDRKGATINQIRSVARRHKIRHGLDMLVVDHIGLVKVDNARATDVQRITEITRELKLLAKELDVPLLALSQLNRQLEQRPNKRPIPSDLRDSGTIEQDADMIIFVYRDEVYHPDTDQRGVAEIIVGVAREIEPCTVLARYQGKYSRFGDLADDYQQTAPRPSRTYASSSLLD